MMGCSTLWPSAASVLDRDAGRTHVMWFTSGAFPFTDEGVQQSNFYFLALWKLVSTHNPLFVLLVVVVKAVC